MKSFILRTLAAVLLASAAGHAFAADLPEPPIVEAPAVDYQPAPAFGGWYIRGDIDYHWNDFRRADYHTFYYDEDHYGKGKGEIVGKRNGRLDGDLDESWSVGAGVGYQITDYLRTDLTADYFASADFHGHSDGYCTDADGTHECRSSDKTKLDAWLLLANVYADLGTYYGFTPYVGAGIGGAYLKWDDLKNTLEGKTTRHDGNDDWRFAWALMAGTSYCLTSNLDLDVGYRFAHVEDGEMFGYAMHGGPGYDDGLNIHEVKAGIRYNFGGGRPACSEPEPIAYEPPPEPVYK